MPASRLGALAVLCALGFVALSPAAAAQEREVPLPRWREGGTPYDAAQPLVPRTLHAPVSFAPAAGLVASPPEYSPARGVLFRYSSSSWPTVVRDCVVALTADPAHDEIAYVVVSSASQQSSAANTFAAAGADMSKVQFLLQPTDSIWLRDYGPHFVWQDGALALVDSHYYPTRPQDNFVPTLVGDTNLLVPTYDMPLYYSGGNFQPGPGRSGFCTALVNTDNPASLGFDAAWIAGLYQRFQGIDTLHVLPQLPTTVDGTGHIDMWMYLVDEDDVIISQFKPGSNATAIQITDNAVAYMQALGFTVHRPPAWNAGGVHYTYTNAFRVNDRIFVPAYASGNASYAADDQAALAIWQAAAGPGVQIVPIDCYGIIPAAGAIHCIVMQVPRYVDPLPSAHVIAPAGGELLVPGTTARVEWVATDTDNRALSSVDLSWSPDGGTSWQWIARVADTGRFDWTVPDVATERGRLRVVATAVDGDAATAVSAADFRVAPAVRTSYDFAAQAGVTRRAWGYQTASWAALDAVRLPVASALSAASYAALATSNAIGGDSDPNRYVSATPGSSSECTHVFEFTLQEPAWAIDALEFTLEGYADTCAQVELYVWDVVLGRWTDGAGAAGENRSADTWAGNQDGLLVASLRADLDRYVAPGGLVTFLAYVERGGNEAFFDRAALLVTDVPDSGLAVCAGDGTGAACPCGNAGAAASGCGNSVAAAGARLEAFGAASVAADGLRLACHGLPPATTLSFVQGSSALNGGAGAAFGDGLRCVGGTAVRLGIRGASLGTAGFGPAYGDEPVSVRGGVPAGGGTFVYQAWYRDPPAFCTPDGFNWTNGVQVVWAP